MSYKKSSFRIEFTVSLFGASGRGCLMIIFRMYITCHGRTWGNWRSTGRFSRFTMKSMEKVEKIWVEKNLMFKHRVMKYHPDEEWCFGLIPQNDYIHLHQVDSLKNSFHSMIWWSPFCYQVETSGFVQECIHPNISRGWMGWGVRYLCLHPFGDPLH